MISNRRKLRRDKLFFELLQAQFQKSSPCFRIDLYVEVATHTIGIETQGLTRIGSPIGN